MYIASVLLYGAILGAKCFNSIEFQLNSTGFTPYSEISEISEKSANSFSVSEISEFEKNSQKSAKSQRIHCTHPYLGSSVDVGSAIFSNFEKFINITFP